MNPKMYKGSLEPLILKLLSEDGEMYGYQLTKIIKERTNGEIEIKEGSLYPLLHKMESDGSIESTIKKVGNRPRKYYHITEKGGEKAASLFTEMENYLKIMSSFFNPNPQLD